MHPIPLLSTAYLPPISYIRYFMKQEMIALDQHEHYIKQTYRNRCHIYGANGLLPLIVPVSHQDLYTLPIREVRISYQEPWQKIHWRSIESAYRNSPFFDYFEDEFRLIFQEPVEKLFEWNLLLLRKILSLLKINTVIGLTSAFEKDPVEYIDLRSACNPEEMQSGPGIHYHQVFQGKKGFGFLQDLSVIDLLFNEGKYARELLTAN